LAALDCNLCSQRISLKLPVAPVGIKRDLYNATHIQSQSDRQTDRELDRETVGFTRIYIACYVWGPRRATSTSTRM